MNTPILDDAYFERRRLNDELRLATERTWQFFAREGLINSAYAASLARSTSAATTEADDIEAYANDEITIAELERRVEQRWNKP